MDKNACKSTSKRLFCDICKCFIPSDSLVAIHNKGKKHQKLLAVVEKKKKSSNCSVFVRGFKKESDIENDLRKALCKYGSIIEVYVDKEKSSFAIVEFEDESSVSNLLKSEQKPVIDGQNLVIKPRQLKESNPLKYSLDNDHGKEKTDEEIKIERALLTCSNLNEQMEKLVEVQKLTTDDINLRFKLCELLEEIFKEIYHDSKVLPFGSTTSGLGCCGCDLDMTLVTSHLSDYLHGKDECSRIDVDADVDDRSNVSVSSNQDIDEICNILRKFVPGCKNVFPVRSAHCPLIKFRHKDSSLNCDLSINNRLAIHNSKLLSSYCEIDGRFRILAYTIRCWATAKGLAGKSGVQLTKYAWTLMLIHYLQQCDPRVLPCLQEGKSEDQNECIIDGWNCFYDKNFNPNMEGRCSVSYGEHLAGFFEYFLNFDWRENAVCISCSQMLTKKHFIGQFETVEIKTSFKDGPVWIPDPFELTHNVAHNMTEQGLESLKTQFKSALILMRSCAQTVTSETMALAGNSETHEQDDYQTSKVSVVHTRENETALVPDVNDCTIKVDNVNLLLLLKPNKAKPSIDGRKRIKVKFSFNVYDPSLKSGEDLCRRCAAVTLQVLRCDLKMRCIVTCKEKDMDRKCSSVSLNLENRVSGNDLTATSSSGCKDLEKGHDLGTEIGFKHKITAEDSGTSTTDEYRARVPIEPSMDRHGDAAPRKRSFSGDDDATERPAKSQRLSSDENDADETHAEDCELPKANLESVTITATAWANTWTNRRKQRRILDSLKTSDGTQGIDTKDDAFVPFKSTPGVPVRRLRDRDDVDREGFLTTTSGPILSNTVMQPLLPLEKLDEMSNDARRNPTCVAEIMIAKNKDFNKGPYCRVTVKMIEGETINLFHSFFAFFKKTVLQELEEYK